MEHGSIVNQTEIQSTHVPRWLAIMRNHPLFCYFFIAYVICWGIGFSFILLLHYPVNILLAILVTLGPTGSSFIMTAATQGRTGIKNLLKRYIRWRVGVIWYLLVLIAIPALLVLSTLIVPENTVPLSNVWQYPLNYVLVFFVGGPFMEEPGWRGFALPRLQQRLGPLRGSLLLGVLWAFWHLPLFFVPGYNGAGVGFVGISTTMLEFMVATAFIAVIFTWIFNNTRGSLLLVMLLHASINTASNLSVPSSSTAMINQIVSLIIIALALLIIMGTKGQLSYQRYKCETAQTSPEPLAPITAL